MFWKGYQITGTDTVNLLTQQALDCSELDSTLLKPSSPDAVKFNSLRDESSLLTETKLRFGQNHMLKLWSCTQVDNPFPVHCSSLQLSKLSSSRDEMSPVIATYFNLAHRWTINSLRQANPSSLGISLRWSQSCRIRCFRQIEVGNQSPMLLNFLHPAIHKLWSDVHFPMIRNLTSSLQPKICTISRRVIP